MEKWVCNRIFFPSESSPVAGFSSNHPSIPFCDFISNFESIRLSYKLLASTRLASVLSCICRRASSQTPVVCCCDGVKAGNKFTKALINPYRSPLISQGLNLMIDERHFRVSCSKVGVFQTTHALFSSRQKLSRRYEVHLKIKLRLWMEKKTFLVVNLSFNICAVFMDYLYKKKNPKQNKTFSKKKRPCTCRWTTQRMCMRVGKLYLCAFYCQCYLAEPRCRGHSLAGPLGGLKEL